MNIVRAKIKDCSEIERLNEKYFKEIRDFKEIIQGKNDYFFVGRKGEKIVGFSGFHFYRWNNTARIINIFIHPDFRRKGYAMEFIKKIKREAKKLNVRTIIAEAPLLNKVLSLYLRNGFRICGFNDRYYSNTGKEIALFLSCDLK